MKRLAAVKERSLFLNVDSSHLIFSWNGRRTGFWSRLQDLLFDTLEKVVSSAPSQHRFLQSLPVSFVLLSSQTNPISITPTFHNDGCYFSPCFVLPSEKVPMPLPQKEHLQNRQRLKCDFDEKIRVSLQENAEHTTNEEELRQALPNSKYCQLCQAQFEDYYYHINGKSHQTCTSHSHAQPFI